MTQPALTIEKYSYAYPGSRDAVLKDIDLALNAGECLCITGPTGSGKSTLLLAIKNLLPESETSGEIISLNKGILSGSDIGIVLQNPETQLLANTIGSEAAFGLENLCVPPDQMGDRVRWALSAVGLDFPLDFPVVKLSMGQKYRLIVASVLAMGSRIILLDEPGAQLDPSGIQKLIHIISRLKKEGVAFVICEHHPHLFPDIIDAHLQLGEDGTLRPAGDVPEIQGAVYDSPGKRTEIQNDSDVLLEVENLSVSNSESLPIWSSVCFTIGKGRRVGIYGENGAGKTTLLRCLTGIIPPSNGRISVFGRAPAPGWLRHKTACMFQNPQKQIFENTVFDEIAFPLKRMGLSKSQTQKEVNRLLCMMDMETLALQSPHKLSYGQKHLVVLASVLAHSPLLLILDDPFAGLDLRWRKMVQNLLLNISEEKNMTLIWTGHHEDGMEKWADFILEISGGRLVHRA
jgi:energy-coupling factor transport system ATP-binding protein